MLDAAFAIRECAVMQKLTEGQVRDLVRRKLQKQTQASLATELSISPAYLCDYINGRRNAGESIAKGLGLRRVILYVKDP